MQKIHLDEVCEAEYREIDKMVRIQGDRLQKILENRKLVLEEVESAKFERKGFTVSLVNFQDHSKFFAPFLPPHLRIQKGKVKLQVDNYGHVVVSGERKVNENKFIRFSQSYDAPENSNIDETGGKFEDGILQRK
ncbi:hypothetical protein LIER_04060 [Lithospermum erythrorhizon]|uniref:SHSP domain-containing protein n=1 Tax=Lithospermum erythrorhizon TaxID=34254 RepID=A0AAV3NZI7_LITER